MNITSIEIYWLTRLDEFRFLFGLMFVTSVILMLVNIIGGFIAMDNAHTNRCLSYGNRNEVPNDEAQMRRRFSRALKNGVATFLIGTAMSFIPSTKQMAAILIIPKIANCEVVAEVSDATKELIGLARDWMKTLAPSRDKQEGETK